MQISNKVNFSLRMVLGLTTLVLATVMAGCASGGGGGGGGVGSPSPGSSGSTSPAPGYPALPSSLSSPTGVYTTNSQFESTKYRYAHVAGVTGAGVNVAVVDTGVSPHSKLSTRLLDGIDAVGGTQAGKEDGVGHGTHVAGIIAASVSGSGMVGIAPSANILPIRVLDNSNYGTSTEFSNGIQNSAALQAKIYNISLGFATATPLTSVETTMAWLRDNGKLAVVAAGNDGTANPGYPANSPTNMAGSLIVVGSVESNEVISSYSNRAGTAKNVFLVAPGSGIVSLSNTNPTGYKINSGTSMAAPVVTAAAALVWGYWPYLKAAEVSNILFSTAKDLGAPGVDDVYGHGLVDIKAALSPIGTLSMKTVKGATLTAGTPVATVVGAAGAVLQAAKVNPVYFDSYKRSFSLPLGQAIAVAAENNTEAAHQGLAGLMDAPVTDRVVTPNFSMSAKASSLAAALDPGLDYRLKLEAGQGVAHMFGGAAYLPFAQTGYFAGKASFAGASALKNPYLQWSNNPQGFGFSSQAIAGLASGVLTFGSATGRDKLGQSLTTNLLEARWSRAATELSIQLGTQEGATAFAGLSATGTKGATSFVSVAGGVEATPGLWAHANYTAGSSSTRGFDVIAGGQVRTEALSFGVIKDGLVSDKDRIGLSLSMPNRVSGGAVNLNLPTSVTADGTPVYTSVPVSLQPTGLEQVLELAWSTPLMKGSVGFSFARRFQPNHDAEAAAIDVAAVRWQSKF